MRAVWVEQRGEAGDTIDFYLKLGFGVRGVNDCWYTNDDDTEGQHTLYMYRELGH